VTHDLSEAFRLADRVAVMQAGRVRQVGTREDLMQRPADAFVREFVSEFEA
jgi:ABC-type proline/glycine betaine transport system ATPase subunit